MGDNFYLLASGWKWKIQKSTSENDNSAVEVIIVIFHVRSEIGSLVGCVNVGSKKSDKPENWDKDAT